MSANIIATYVIKKIPIFQNLLKRFHRAMLLAWTLLWRLLWWEPPLKIDCIVYFNTMSTYYEYEFIGLRTICNIHWVDANTLKIMLPPIL